MSVTVYHPTLVQHKLPSTVLPNSSNILPLGIPKRPAEPLVSPHSSLKNCSRETADEGANHPKYQPEMGQFEDNYEDEYKEVEEVLEAGDEDGEEGGAKIGGKSGGRRDSMEIDQQEMKTTTNTTTPPTQRRTRSSNLAPSNPTTTNRIRASPHAHHAASMAETGDVYIWKLSLHYRAFESPGTAIPASANKPMATLRMYRHRHVFASASSDGTVKVYDARAQTMNHQLSVDVSSSDVNVASWCRAVPHLLATGADNGIWGVWDLRTFPNTRQVITSVEFHPTEDSIVSVASADSTITLWDLSVELDDDESKDTGGVEDIPPQLLFVHYHKDVKEVHWQKQASGVVIGTGGDINFLHIHRKAPSLQNTVHKTNK
ncbi:WD40 repeat-like protein [Choiromyces venosus 120613-1]|uniref:WD40 repeat-like protein n=1 Tax=Choiromyces venosus 120613-1 TaxID=1336337 RepID=A0A3N4J8G9_9PEZI|nr:WD40 repeat-like protein [Choiromyces venosus 120613-1]